MRRGGEVSVVSQCYVCFKSLRDASLRILAACSVLLTASCVQEDRIDVTF